MSTVHMSIDGFIQIAVADVKTSPPTILHLDWSERDALNTLMNDTSIETYRNTHPVRDLHVIQILTKYTDNVQFIPPGYGGSGGGGGIVPPVPPDSATAFSQMAERYRKHFGTEKVIVPPPLVGAPSVPPEQPAPVPITKKEEKPNG